MATTAKHVKSLDGEGRKVDTRGELRLSVENTRSS